MGEAKRRKELGFPTKKKKIKIEKSNQYSSWVSIFKSRLKNSPYMGVATLIIGVFIFLVSGGANNITN